MMKLVNLLCGILFFVTWASLPAFGCSCLAKPSTLDAFDRSEDVFVAEILTVEVQKEGETVYWKHGGIDGARVRVQTTYKGDLKPGDVVFLEQGGGADCIWTFRKEMIGIKVLIYDTPHGGKRFISECGRSNSLRFAADDLRYLENLHKVRGKTRVAGTYSFGYFGGVPTGHSIAGKRIRVIGKAGTFVATTDTQGVYEIYDIPPGKYYIEPELPTGWKLDKYAIERSLDTNPPTMALYEYLESGRKWPNRIPINVEKGAHVSLDFRFEIDNSVTGRVLGPTGRPIKGVCVTAVPADKTDFRYGPSRCTDALGKFTITELYFSEFVLVINGDGEVSGDEPIPMQFFPGVHERSAAKVLKLGQGGKLVLPYFRVRKLVDTVTLSGTLLYSDGRPVTSRQKVQFIADKADKTRKSDPYDYTDDLGRFELKILKGQSGKIRGEMIMGERQRLGCPDVLAGVVEEKDYGGIFTAATTWLSVAALRSESELKLEFGFRECKVP